MIYIQGDRIFMKSMTREEYHLQLQKYVPDPIMDPGPYQYDREAADRRYDKISDMADDHIRLGIFLAGGEIIGELAIKRIERDESRCELGIALANDSYKGMGYGSEAFALAVRYAVHTLGLRSVYADTMGTNPRMQRILEREGFRMISVDEQFYDMGDRMEDRLNYVYVYEGEEQ